jgi:hypothetical protein
MLKLVPDTAASHRIASHHIASHRHRAQEDREELRIHVVSVAKMTVAFFKYKNNDFQMAN